MYKHTCYKTVLPLSVNPAQICSLLTLPWLKVGRLSRPRNPSRARNLGEQRDSFHTTGDTFQYIIMTSENKQKMARGELYYAFTPELAAERARCKTALRAYNAAVDTVSRRETVRLWRE